MSHDPNPWKTMRELARELDVSPPTVATRADRGEGIQWRERTDDDDVHPAVRRLYRLTPPGEPEGEQTAEQPDEPTAHLAHEAWMGSDEAALAWHEAVAAGEILDSKGDPRGGVHHVLPSLATRQKSHTEAVRLRAVLAERERWYIPRQQVEDALYALGAAIRDSLLGLPPQLVGLSEREIRTVVETAIARYGDDVARRLRELVD